MTEEAVNSIGALALIILGMSIVMYVRYRPRRAAARVVVQQNPAPAGQAGTAQPNAGGNPQTPFWRQMTTDWKVVGIISGMFVLLIGALLFFFGTNLSALIQHFVFWIMAFSLIVVGIVAVFKGKGLSLLILGAVILIFVGTDAGQKAATWFGSWFDRTDSTERTYGRIELPSTLYTATAVKLAGEFREVTILPGTCLEGDPEDLIETRRTNSRGLIEIKSKTNEEITVFLTRKRVWTCG